MIAREPLHFMAVVLAMALAAYATRIGGYWLIGRFPLNARLLRMLDALPGAVIAAVVLPTLVKGGPSAVLAVAAAMTTMVFVRNDFAAVLAGVARSRISPPGASRPNR